MNIWHTGRASGDQIRLAVFYGAIFTVMGLHTPYWPVWLQAQGLDGPQIGGLVAAGLMMRLMSGPLLGAVVDQVGERRRPAIVLAGLGLASFCLFLGVCGLWGLFAVTVLSMTFYPALLPLIETLAVSRARECGFDYGRTRLWGSLTFIGASLGGGALLARAGPDMILPAILLAFGGTLLAGFALPSDAVPKEAPAKAAPCAPSGPSPLTTVIQSPLFWLFAISGGLVQGTHAVYYGFSSIHWRSLGLSGDLIGVLWAIGVIAEILLFSVSGRILARLGPLGLLGLGAGAGVVRWTVMGFDPPLALLIAAQILHAGTFGATHLGAVHLIDRAVPRRCAVTAQSLYFALSGGVVLGSLTLGAGALYDAAAGAAYFAMAGVSLLALAGVWLLVRLWRTPSIIADQPAGG
ncbi:MAG: MFS transporter [Alphaproteobacteria bacterium]